MPTRSAPSTYGARWPTTRLSAPRAPGARRRSASLSGSTSDVREAGSYSHRPCPAASVLRSSGRSPSGPATAAAAVCLPVPGLPVRTGTRMRPPHCWAVIRVAGAPQRPPSPPFASDTTRPASRGHCCLATPAGSRSGPRCPCIGPAAARIRLWTCRPRPSLPSEGSVQNSCPPRFLSCRLALMSATVHAGETAACIGGKARDPCGARRGAANADGAPGGATRGAAWRRGDVSGRRGGEGALPSPVGRRGQELCRRPLARAREQRHGSPSMHVRRIRLDSDANANLKERGNCTPRDLAGSCRGPEPRHHVRRDVPGTLQRRKAARGNRRDAPHGGGGGLP